MKPSEIERLREALDKSVRMNSHYAKLLNIWDGGEHLVFETTEAWLGRRATMSYNPSEVELREALDESVQLQAHYAKLLNMRDGGERLVFETTEAWLDRLEKLRSEKERQ